MGPQSRAKSVRSVRGLTRLISPQTPRSVSVVASSVSWVVRDTSVLNRLKCLLGVVKSGVKFSRVREVFERLTKFLKISLLLVTNSSKSKIACSINYEAYMICRDGSHVNAACTVQAVAQASAQAAAQAAGCNGNIPATRMRAPSAAGMAAAAPRGSSSVRRRCRRPRADRPSSSRTR